MRLGGVPGCVLVTWPHGAVVSPSCRAAVSEGRPFPWLPSPVPDVDDDEAASEALNTTGRLLVCLAEHAPRAEQAAARTALAQLALTRGGSPHPPSPMRVPTPDGAPPHAGGFASPPPAAAAHASSASPAKNGPDPTPCIATSPSGAVAAQLRAACGLAQPDGAEAGGEGGKITLLLTDFSDDGHFFVSRSVEPGCPVGPAAAALLADWRSGKAERGVATLGGASDDGCGDCEDAFAGAAARAAAGA